MADRRGSGEAIQLASGTTAAGAVPPFDQVTRDTWIRGVPSAYPGSRLPAGNRREQCR